ncbi:MAG: hypothetical protein ACOC1X_01235 [Promethearchaeota archaeon]
MYHEWFINSISWSEDVVCAKDKWEVRKQAKEKVAELNKTGVNHWGYHIVEGNFNLTYNPKQRKLTWKERLTGKIDNSDKEDEVDNLVKKLI